MTIGYYWPHTTVSTGMASHFYTSNDTEKCGVPRTFLNDGVNTTCKYSNEMDKQLQAVFFSPLKTADQRMTVEVILKNVEDCSSPAWTWYVESDCQLGAYTQCDRSNVERGTEYTRCLITCMCIGPCDFLYLKYDRLPWQDQAREQLCELRFIKKRVG